MKVSSMCFNHLSLLSLLNKRTSAPSFSPLWPLCLLEGPFQLLYLSPSLLWRRASLITTAMLVVVLLGMSCPLLAALGTTLWRSLRENSPPTPRQTVDQAANRSVTSAASRYED